ncbi:hypothetical protein [Streptomyces sp. NPDC048659]|uniref:hypothetical protein n=1 Tax=Streptomyces sp. NPDC048659 TaxID=3155489 RepID=UPI00341F42D0
MALLALTACADGGQEPAEIAKQELVGSWTGEKGERMQFSSDQTFRFTSVSLESQTYLSCPSGASTGEWSFFVSRGDGLFSDPQADSGKSIALTFDGQDLGGCGFFVSVVDGGKTLCLSDDPDHLCTVESMFSRVESRS